MKAEDKFDFDIFPTPDKTSFQGSIYSKGFKVFVVRCSSLINMGHSMVQNLGKVKLIKRFMQLLSQMVVVWKYSMTIMGPKTDMKGVKV